MRGPVNSSRWVRARGEVIDTPCGYCFEEWATGYDHILPVSRGGRNAKKNLYPCCKRCNGLLSNKLFKSLEEKRDYVREKLKERGEWNSADKMREVREDV